MKGVEMMLANLLGMKPDELRSQVESALHLMKTGASAAERMQRDIDAIKRHLNIAEEPIENVGRKSIPHGSHIEL